ncbi:helix-turn-helix domain-containing protein [Methylocella silvestris]|uniref:AraC family transcriptional regulator n=1 Tax=Methylocella silvestris TaxID=199596 RepID=A0A2J7TLE5_METSI|nr:helix-turn-helix domain-containing protein [Methylocella silvestris]PNG27591.1 AraC family transcriptional regulator [Methylocella silvestris]
MDALQPTNEAASREQSRPLRLSTNDVAPGERSGWLRDVICREYANVEVTSPTRQILSQDLTIYPWDCSRLSVIRSSGVGLKRLPREPLLAGQDAYFVVVLLSGDYALEQDGKEVVLQPGDMTLYDATRPHKIDCPRDFSKLILAIPRPLLRERMAGVEHSAALRISGSAGIGAVASRFLRSCGKNADEFAPNEILALADQAVDLVSLAAASVRPSGFSLSRSRALSMRRVKALVEGRLADPELDTAKIARLARLSPRYLSGLFGDEGTSLMRYVWSRRLENCAKDFSDPRRAADALSEIAFRWGFSDASHFSRAFKQRFGCAPREFRQGR